MKKCKQCDNIFHTETFAGKTCSVSCSNLFFKEKQKEAKERDKIKKLERQEKIKLKKKETVTSLKKSLWKIISEYIRTKNADSDGIVSCVTCGATKHWKELQAGHFVPSGASSYLRYVENNIHPQCYHCNINIGSNPIEYRIFMINTYGEKFVEQMLSMRNEPCSLKPYDLKVLIEEYKEKLSKLNK